MAENEELYFNIANALEYAKRQGYPFGKSKFYADLKYVPRVNNKFSKKEIDKHIKLQIINSSGLTASDESSEKLRQDTRAAKARADKLEFEHEIAQGRYIPLSEVEKMLSGRAALLRSGIENYFKSFIPKMIALAEGKQENVQEVISFCDIEIETLFDNYSQDMEFETPLLPSTNTEDSE